MTKPKLDRELVSQLKASRKNIGQLLPVLLDSQGHVVDGLHRLKADPLWKKETLQLNERQSLTARLALNAIRHEVSDTDFNELAAVLRKEGVPRDQIGKVISSESGCSYSSVLRHLDDRYKRPRGPDLDLSWQGHVKKPKKVWSEPSQPVSLHSGFRAGILGLEKAAEFVSGLPAGKLTKLWLEVGSHERDALKKKVEFALEACQRLLEAEKGVNQG
jgi:hypothetical protein